MYRNHNAPTRAARSDHFANPGATPAGCWMEGMHERAVVELHDQRFENNDRKLARAQKYQRGRRDAHRNPHD